MIPPLFRLGLKLIDLYQFLSGLFHDANNIKKYIYCTGGNGKHSLKGSMKPWTKPYVHGTFSGCCLVVWPVMIFCLILKWWFQRKGSWWERVMRLTDRIILWWFRIKCWVFLWRQKTNHQLLRQKVPQRISVMKTNTLYIPCARHYNPLLIWNCSRL